MRSGPASPASSAARSACAAWSRAAIASAWRRSSVAGLGQRDGPRAAGTVDQPLADDPLQHRDLLADRRLRVAELARGAAERALLGDRLQGDQVTQLEPEPVSVALSGSIMETTDYTICANRYGRHTCVAWQMIVFLTILLLAGVVSVMGPIPTTTTTTTGGAGGPATQVQRDACAEGLRLGRSAIVYVVWGSTYLGIDLAVRTIPPFLMAAMRFLIAGGLLYAWAIRRGDRATGRRARHWLSAFLIAAPMLAVGNAAVGWAEQTLDTGTASLIIASVPLWMALLDRIFYAQRLARVVVLGLVVGFAGVGLLVAPGGPAAAGAARRSCSSSARSRGRSARSTRGGAAAAAAARRRGDADARRRPDPRPSSPPRAASSPGVHPAEISLESWLGLAYLVVAGSLVALHRVHVAAPRWRRPRSSAPTRT